MQYNRHLESLRLHGAKILYSDGQTAELNSSFAEKAINKCVQNGYNAAIYGLSLPNIDEPMAICFWHDGRISSGSVKSILKIMEGSVD